MLKITRKNTLLLGTLILTASGIICRILGFLYRIFLSRRIGAEAFGIYQLATPLYALMLSLAQAACRRCSRALSHRTLPKRIPDGQRSVWRPDAAL